MRVDNSRIRTKKLRVQKDIDTCGRGQCALSPNFLKFYDGTFFCLAFARKVFEWEAKVILKCDPTFGEAKFDVVDVAGDWVSQGKNEWQMGEL